MHILIVSQYFWPEVFRINEIAADLTARGHDVTVLTGQPNYPAGTVFAEYREDPARFAAYEGARIIRVPLVARGKSKLRLLLNYVSFALSGLAIGGWRLSGRRFDVILVFQASPVTAAVPALLQRRLKRAPLAMWIVDLWPETLSAIGVVRSRAALGLVGRLVAFIYRRCDLIMVQSRAFIPSVRSRAPEHPQVRYFPAWAEATFELDWEAVTPAPEVTAFSGTFNVLFAGNVGEAQDFPTILTAAELLRERADIRWLIVGDGRDARSVAAMIAQRGLGERVHMLGRFPLERMPGFFKAADALLVSLRPEPVFAMTIPGKVQSYMRSGKPLVALLEGEGKRVISESGAGVVCEAGNARSLADAVVGLASAGEAARAAMGARGLAYCRAQFDRAMLLERLDHWLAELAAKERATEKGAAGASNP